MMSVPKQLGLNLKSVLNAIPDIEFNTVYLLSGDFVLFPQTGFDCRGSYGVDNGALICVTARRRYGGAVLLVIYLVW